LKILDPDRRVWASDKLQHFGAGVGVAAILLALGLTPALSLGISLAIAVTYEIGQLDVAHSLGVAGKPGFGISPLDIGAHVTGTLLVIALHCVVSHHPLSSSSTDARGPFVAHYSDRPTARPFALAPSTSPQPPAVPQGDSLARV